MAHFSQGSMEERGKWVYITEIEFCHLSEIIIVLMFPNRRRRLFASLRLFYRSRFCLQTRVAHRALLDGCASWWTHGGGHGNPGMALAVAEAAGRYGHVIFPGNVHAPALEVT